MKTLPLPITPGNRKEIIIKYNNWSCWLEKDVLTRWSKWNLILLIISYLLVLTAIWYNFRGNINSGATLPSTTIIDTTTNLSELRKEVAQLEKKLNALTPRNGYIIVNTSQNDFRLYKNNQLVREGKCSTGSYIMLQNGDKQRWIFRTPKGEFRIQSKTKSPVWKKPDWAFVEDGLKVPSANHSSRYVYGVLGDYSLSLGSGYLIHGTLYKRFLGLPVTHGCIRMNDEDLEEAFKTLSVGSKVYIF